MPRVTIIRDDNLVGVDGVFRTVNLAGLSPNIHAIQWNGTSGFTEFKGGKIVQPLTSIGEYLNILDAWALAAPPPEPEHDEVERAEKEVAQLRAEAAAVLEEARIEAALEAEAARVGGSARARAYVRAKGELAALKQR